MRSAMLLLMLSVAGLHAGCQHQTMVVEEPISRTEEAAMQPEDAVPIPSIEGSDSSEGRPASDGPLYGDETELEALFVIDPVAGSKRLQPETLVLETGERWIVAYRPIRSHFRFADKRVVVRGRPYWNPGHVQSVTATHFEVESIELALGETPHDPPPAELPAPPQVRARSELEARLGHGLWVHCVGVVSSLRPSEEDDTLWLEGTFVLADGAEVPLRRISKSRQAFVELVGATSTILARIVGAEASQLQLSPATICAGVVDRCQMTLDNTRDL